MLCWLLFLLLWQNTSPKSNLTEEGLSVHSLRDTVRHGREGRTAAAWGMASGMAPGASAYFLSFIQFGILPHDGITHILGGFFPRQL